AIELLQQGIQRIPQNTNLYIAYANLLVQDNQIEEAIELLQQGIQRIPQNTNLYIAYANLLVQNNRIEEAIELLQQGIQRIPPDKNLRQLYIRCGSLLGRNHRVEEAIIILREGLSVIPYNNHSRYRLAENAMLFCLANKDILTLEEILAGTGKNSLPPETVVLGKVLIAQLKGNWQAAAEIAHQATTKFNSIDLITQEAFSWLCIGNIDVAAQVIQSISYSLGFTQGNPVYWLKAYIAVKKSDYELAEEMLVFYLDRPLKETEIINQSFLLYLWDISVDFREGINVAFSFPTLPPSLTGFEISITRQQNNVNVLPDILNKKMYTDENISSHEKTNDLLTNNLSTGQQALNILSRKNDQENQLRNISPMSSKVFISYNHNDKDIVDKIKEKLESEQINVVIDSKNLLGGRDIEEFINQAIKNTDVTLLMVSKDSLLSAWVAMESIKTLSVSEINQSAKFIPCLIKDDISSRTFTDDVLDIIENEIREINSVIKYLVEKNRVIEYLQNDLARYKKLESNIGEIVRNIKESSYIDLGGDKLDDNFPKLLRSIRGN
ncbi:MAG: TIR domain-containing protein, partial [Cyanobacteria bacterium P01_F01_bin.143]